MAALGTPASAKGRSSRVFVGNVQSGDVSVIDLATLSVVDTIKLVPPAEKTIHGVTVQPDGQRLFVTTETDNSLRIIDTATDKVLATVKLSGRPNQPGVTMDGRFVAVPIRDKASVDIVSVAEGRVVKTFPMGEEPHNSLREPGSSRYLWVTSRGGGDIDKIDLETMEKVAKIPVGGVPRPFWITRDGKTMYVALTKLHGFVVVDIPTGKVVRKVEMPAKHPEPHPMKLESVGTYTHGLGLSPDEKELWVTSLLDNVMYVYDLKADKVIAEPPTGDEPNWVTFSADGRYCIVTNGGDDSVSVYSRKTHKEVARIPVGRAPKRLDAADVPAAGAPALAPAK
jgi:YVTN family beta-propeller protein